MCSSHCLPAVVHVLAADTVGLELLECTGLKDQKHLREVQQLVPFLVQVQLLGVLLF